MPDNSLSFYLSHQRHHQILKNFSKHTNSPSDLTLPRAPNPTQPPLQFPTIFPFQHSRVLVWKVRRHLSLDLPRPLSLPAEPSPLLMLVLPVMRNTRPRHLHFLCIYLKIYAVYSRMILGFCSPPPLALYSQVLLRPTCSSPRTTLHKASLPNTESRKNVFVLNSPFSSISVIALTAGWGGGPNQCRQKEKCVLDAKQNSPNLHPHIR